MWKNVEYDMCMRRIHAVIKDKKAISVLDFLMKDNPDLTTSAVISRLLLKQGMQDLFITTPSQHVKVFKRLSKEHAIEKYGGVVHDDMVIYTRYEETPSGDVVKVSRRDSYKSFPETEEEIRKYIIGPFKTLEEAKQNIRS